MVNGRTWPRLDVQPRRYRLRLLNGSNARFYHLRLVDEGANEQTFVQIGTDGGYLPKPVTLHDLLLAPGERADLLVDFSFSSGQHLRFVNDAGTPYPGGDSPDPETTGQILQFVVASSPGVHEKSPPSTLAEIPTLVADSPTRVLALFEIMGDGGPLVRTLQGQTWDAPPSETPRVGSTEEWQLVTLTEHAHPIHIHLIQFQLVRRQHLAGDVYEKAWIELNGSPKFPVNGPVRALATEAYLEGDPSPPNPNELGWKDTLAVFPGEVTTIRVRFAPTTTPVTGPDAAAPGVNKFPFDPTAGPGYVWHCHILEHEDNEMMRPLQLKP
jgi:FtsP/CotA-like multicopper oxidase with cupredoxin domain